MLPANKSASELSARAGRRVIALLTVAALLLTLPLVPRSDAQDVSSLLPSSSEQKQAAKNLLTQLDNIDGAVDPTSLSFDPALGPAPWVAYVPGRDQSTIDAWTVLSERLTSPKTQSPAAARFALPGSQIVVQDVEGVNDSGQNDTAATGQLVAGFGTGPGQSGFARIIGTLSTPPPPPPEPDCPSVEEDGAIPLANSTPLSVPGITIALCGGVIGDGTYGGTTGDVDFYAMNAVPAGTLLSVDAGSFDPNAVFSVTTGIYNQDGNLLGSLDDSDSSGASVLTVVAPTDGQYFAVVAGVGGLPTDPFDPASGTGVTYVGDYLILVGTNPAPPPPCIAAEPDSTIPEANQLPFGPGEIQPCIGLIGDGTFGDSTGDFDFFAVEVDLASDIIIDVAALPGQGSTPTTVALFDSDGNLLAALDDDGLNPNNFLVFSVDGPGTYYALVSSQGVLPGDPFDESSGSVAGPEVNYQVFILSFPLLGPPPPPPLPTPPVPTPTPPVGPGEPPVPGPTPTPTPTPTPPVGPGEPPVPGPTPPPTPTPTATPVVPVPLPFGADQEVTPNMAAAMAMIGEAQQQRAGELAAAMPPAFAELDEPCESLEDDGAIGLENPAAVEPGQSVQCLGAIGDGPFGQTSGDHDVYSLFVLGGEALVADINAQQLGGLDSLLSIYDAQGNLLAQNDDFDGLDSRVEFPAPVDGLYFVVVSAFATFLDNPFDSSSGNGVASTGPYSLTLARADYVPPDIDVYLVDLAVGDAISTGFVMNGLITIVDPLGQVAMGSGGSAAIIYPPSSPLRHLGNVGADFVAETPGRHAVYLSDGGGPYEGELRVKRAGFADEPGDDQQIIYLDFDGGSFNQAIFDPFAPDDSGPIRTLSPLSAWLTRWGLSADDEDAVIDAIVAEFTEDTLEDLQEFGGNGNRDATGIGGELDLDIRNSRDHADPWGQPNVSRIIIGGSIDEAGIPTVGVAQSIDPGNFDAEETAIVLLDLLSDDPAFGGPTLNQYGVAAPFTKIDLVGRGVGVIAAHEAGHIIGNWHTASFNGVPSVMDEGGDLTTTIGVGNDLIFGTADDVDTDFVTDEFSFFEGFFGQENTTVRSAQAFSTGQTNVDVVVESELPEDGVYYVRNVANGRVLDADANGKVDTSSTPRSDDRWELISIGGDLYNLRNVDFGTYLDADANGVVDQSTTASSDDRWQLIPASEDSFFVYSPDRGRYLSASGNNVRLSSNQTDAQRWAFELVDDPAEPGDGYVGQRVALQSAVTGRWLDGDRNGNVDQSVTQRADDVWMVTDAGEGYVYLRNAVTNGYLDADLGDNNVETSVRPSNDDRWHIIAQGDRVVLRNAQYGGYLVAQGASDRYNVVTEPELSDAAQWTIVVLTNPA